MDRSAPSRPELGLSRSGAPKCATGVMLARRRKSASHRRFCRSGLVGPRASTRCCQFSTCAGCRPAEYGIGLSPNEPNPENAVKDLVSFLPVLAYDGANMTQIDAAGILDIAMAGTSATLLARKWESAVLVHVDNDTLRRVLDNPEAMAAVERIEGWRALGDNIIETIINKSDKVKELKNKAKEKDLTEKQ